MVWCKHKATFLSCHIMHVMTLLYMSVILCNSWFTIQRFFTWYHAYPITYIVMMFSILKSIDWKQCWLINNIWCNWKIIYTITRFFFAFLAVKFAAEITKAIISVCFSDSIDKCILLFLPIIWFLLPQVIKCFSLSVIPKCLMRLYSQIFLFKLTW